MEQEKEDVPKDKFKEIKLTKKVMKYIWENLNLKISHTSQEKERSNRFTNIEWMTR